MCIGGHPGTAHTNINNRQALQVTWSQLSYSYLRPKTAAKSNKETDTPCSNKELRTPKFEFHIIFLS
ncbi:similar to hypothetical protein FLJ22624, isoform CRA_c [Rattus norvegicus]|uniref:Uncharacterized protein RGD1309522 n=1 Tax=Rattus norvegicus TaxID=10116 RepID=A6HU56_RAT|nr:similar to hypothetical protein FLJ22624, isoform CRA_c [Rattus norvegicus]